MDAHLKSILNMNSVLFFLTVSLLLLSLFLLFLNQMAYHKHLWDFWSCLRPGTMAVPRSVVINHGPNKSKTVKEVKIINCLFTCRNAEMNILPNGFDLSLHYRTTAVLKFGTFILCLFTCMNIKIMFLMRSRGGCLTQARPCLLHKYQSEGRAKEIRLLW